MSMRFLHIKRAFVVDSTNSFEVDRDASLNISLLDRVYANSNTHDLCAVTEEGEWLIHGRKINPATILQLYDVCFVYIHSPNDIYDRVFHACNAYAQKYLMLYKATDVLLHHAAQLEGLIKTHALKAKVAHQVHIDVKEHNDTFTPSEIIAGKHIRNIFLPVRVLSSLHKSHIPKVHTHLIAHNFEELADHIDTFRHSNPYITLRAHIEGETICIAALPKFRNGKTYITMPLISKDVDGRIHFQESHLPLNQKKDAHGVIENISNVLFSKDALVFIAKVHGKRGVFIEGTSPFYFFILHNPDFLFELSVTHGIKVEELFSAAL